MTVITIILVAILYGLTIYHLLKQDEPSKRKLILLLYIVFLPIIGIFLFWLKELLIMLNKRPNNSSKV